MYLLIPQCLFTLQRRSMGIDFYLTSAVYAFTEGRITIAVVR